MMSPGQEGPLKGMGGSACLEGAVRSPSEGSPCPRCVRYEKMSIRSY